MLTVHSKLFLYLFIFCIPLLSALDLPDLDDVEDLSSDKKVKPKQSQEKKNEKPGMSLLELEKSIRYSEKLDEKKRLRLLSLVQELKGEYDSAYFTLKKVEGEKGKDWYMMRELYLSDRLGLEEEVEEMSVQVLKRFEGLRLKIDKCLFCTSVKSFGVYEEIPKQTLNLNQRVIIYVEVSGLKQLVGEEGKFSSSFGGSFDVLNSQGDVVFSSGKKQIFQYVSRSKLKDYFIWMKWTPIGLKPGSYELLMKVEDRKGRGEVASFSQAFTIL